MTRNATTANERPVDMDLAVEPHGNRFGELLVRKQLVTIAALNEILLRQLTSGGRLGELLTEAGLLSDEDRAESLSEHLGVPLIDLRRNRPETEAIETLREELARELLALPLRIDDETLDVAVADPTPETEARLRREAGRDVRLFLAPEQDVRRVIDANYRASGAIDEQVKAFVATHTAPKAGQAAIISGSADEAAPPVIRIVNMLIAQGLRDRASDIHIEPQDEQVRVRYRVDGALHDVTTLPIEMGPALASRVKIMAGMNIVERRRPQDGQTSLEIDGRSVDVRVASTPTIFGEKVTMRLLDKSRPLFTGAELGMPDDTREQFAKLVRSPFGMVVCVGPTGSGKTTTLYATLADINSSDRNIMTIEDPVEYVMPTINQIQINEAAGVTFAGGLRSILRQDPDVILVGEVRDAETARIAVQSALTGHLVLSSLHATDTAAAVHRFLDMGIEAFLVASSLVAVVGQRLVRRVCASCATTYTPDDEEYSIYRELGGPVRKRFVKGAGCNFCAGTGYQDRIGVYELLRITPELKRLIVGWATQEEIRRTAVAQGMRTLLDEGLNLVTNNVTTISEVVRVIYAS